MRTRLAAILAAATTLGAATFTGATYASGSDAATRQFTLDATTAHEALLDLGTTNDPTGSEFVSAHELFRGGRQVGVDGAACHVIDVRAPERLRLQCVATLSLPNGQLTAQGLVEANENDTEPFTFAITGGTNGYAGAHGQVTVRPIDDQHSRYVFSLRR